MSSNSTLSVFNELTESIKALGEKQTIDVLRSSRKNNSKNIHILYVIDMVCARLDFNKERITDKNRNSKRNIVIKFICYYCTIIGQHKVGGKKINITNENIAVQLCRTHTSICKHYTEMKNKKQDKEDAYCQGHFKEFDLVIKKYLKTIK